jgi:hypothetical protein
MIDLEWDRRSHDLRDALTVNGVPFAFPTKDSDSGRQLIRNHRVDGTRLPALIRHDGTVLQQPSMAEMPAAAATQPNTFCISGEDGCRLDAVGVRSVAGKAQPFAARHARGSE